MRPAPAPTGDPGKAGLEGDSEVWSTALGELVQLLQPELVRHRITPLPHRARRRYGERLTEILARATRELEEFRAVLEAEPQRQRRRREDLEPRRI